MLKLVSNNDISVDYFESYNDAIEFLCSKFKDKLNYSRLLTRDQAVKHLNNLCDKHIECYEPDNGKNRYKVRILG